METGVTLFWEDNFQKGKVGDTLHSKSIIPLAGLTGLLPREYQWHARNMVHCNSAWSEQSVTVLMQYA